jgi:hypothetical protein
MGRKGDNGVAGDPIEDEEEREMGYDDLLCAACSGRVVDGGCPTCRASRDSLPSLPRLPAGALLALAALLTVLLVLADHLH